MVAKLSVMVEVDEKDFIDLARNVDHHIDYIIDFGSNPEIKNVWGAELEKVQEEEK